MGIGEYRAACRRCHTLEASNPRHRRARTHGGNREPIRSRVLNAYFEEDASLHNPGGNSGTDLRSESGKRVLCAFHQPHLTAVRGQVTCQLATDPTGTEDRDVGARGDAVAQCHRIGLRIQRESSSGPSYGLTARREHDGISIYCHLLAAVGFNGEVEVAVVVRKNIRQVRAGVKNVHMLANLAVPECGQRLVKIAEQLLGQRRAIVGR